MARLVIAAWVSICATVAVAVVMSENNSKPEDDRYLFSGNSVIERNTKTGELTVDAAMVDHTMRGYLWENDPDKRLRLSGRLEITMVKADMFCFQWDNNGELCSIPITHQLIRRYGP